MKKSKRLNSGFKIRQQSGAALLIGMVVLASVVAFYMMGQYGAVSQKHERQESRIASLAQAKKALIAYAVNYIDTHPGEMGFLPCPDTDSAGLNPAEGHQDVGCSGVNENVVGRYPYRTVQTPPLKDDANECLWYAVSGYYKNQPKTQMLNEDTNGMLEIFNAAGNLIYGNNPEERVVAIVIAPRSPLDNQNRPDGVVANTEKCGGNYTASNYLDTGDTGVLLVNNANVSAADVVDDYIKAGTESNLAASSHNDLIITITRDEIWNAIKRRHDYDNSMQTLTQNMTQCLVDYGNLGAARNLPWPANTDLDGNDYREDGSYADVDAPGSLLGRLPDSVINSEAALAAGSFPPGPPGGVPPGPPTGVPPGPPSGSTACENACQMTYDNAVADAVIERDEEIDEARGDDYDECIALGTPRADCNAERQAAIAEARAEYDVEVSEAQIDYAQCVQACGSGGGGGTVCGDCQALYDALVAEAEADRAEEIAEARGSDYQECLNDGNRRNVCNQQRQDDIADAEADYAQDLVDAQAEFDQCQAGTSSCSGGSGEKGIDEILTGCLSAADFTLWQHWKDHFYYVVSGDYAPDSTTVNCNTNCVSVNGTNQAGIVLFSGERQVGGTRNDPVAGDADTKQDISNYLELNNSANYPDANGNGVYDSAAGNDYLYCISATDPLVAGICP